MIIENDDILEVQVLCDSLLSAIDDVILRAGY